MEEDTINGCGQAQKYQRFSSFTRAGRTAPPVGLLSISEWCEYDMFDRFNQTTTSHHTMDQQSYRDSCPTNATSRAIGLRNAKAGSGR